MGDIFAATNSGVSRSTDLGNSWQDANSGLTNINTTSFAINSGGDVFVGTVDGVFRSSDNGENWAEVGTGLTKKYVLALAANDNDDLFAGILLGGVFRSSDNGDNWSEINNGVPATNITAFAFNGVGDVFAGTAGGVYRSTSNGDSWDRINTGLTNTSINSLAVTSAGDIFTGTFDGAFRSSDNGENWTEISAGLTSTSVLSLAVGDSNEVFAGTRNLFRSSDGGDNWSALITNLNNVSAIAINDSGDIFAGGTSIFRSSDNGANWSDIRSGLTNTNVRALAINSAGDMFAGTAGGVFRSQDNGDNWNESSVGLSNLDVRSLAINDSGLVFSGTIAGVFRSSDNGDTWMEINTGDLGTTDRVAALAVSPNGDVYAGSNRGVYRSTDNGDLWTQMNSGLISTRINALAINSFGDIFAGTNEGVFRSNDNGRSWTALPIDLIPKIVSALGIDRAGRIFAAISGNGLFRSVVPTTAGFVRGWYADGQVWIVWRTQGLLPITYGIYASEAPFTHVDQAELIGRLFKGEWTSAAIQQQMVDSTRTYRVPDGQGDYYVLDQDEGLFVETVHESGAKYYAVVKWGETQVVTGVNLTAAVPYRLDSAEPVQSHLQIELVLESGHSSAFYAMWADGRDDHWNGRPDFPVMANRHKNGMPSVFIVSEALDLAPEAKRSVVHWLHGGGGIATHSLPTGRRAINIEPKDGYLVAHNDDFYRYFMGFVLGRPGNSGWFGWAKNHDPFDPDFVEPAPGDTVVNYTQRRILWINDWLVRELNADPERIAIQGHSRGAAGTTAIAKAFPNRFATASIFNNAFGSMTDNDGVGNSINNLYGFSPSQLNLPTNLRNRGGQVVHMNDVYDLATPTAPVRDLPLIRTWHGKNDTNVVMTWDSVFVAQIRSADAGAWGAQLYWDERAHGLSVMPAHWIQGESQAEQTERDNAAYQERYRVNQSFPAFYNHQGYPNNADPGDGTPGTGGVGVGDDWGTWGGYHDWNLDTIVDEPDCWEVTAYLIGQSEWVVDNSPFASLTSDLAIRKPQSFTPDANTIVSWAVVALASGDTLQSGNTAVDENELVKVAGITVHREPDSVRISFKVDVATEVAGSGAGVPERFALYQNYPNPFNPEATIEYELPREVRVTVTVYNSLGKIIATLVNQKQPPGRHKIFWDGTIKSGQMAPAGVYIYRMQAGNYISSRKLVLLR